MNGDPTRTAIRPEHPANEDPSGEATRRVEAWLLRDRHRRRVFASEGRVEAVEEAGGGRFAYAYDRRGDLAQIVEANGRRTTFDYDDHRRLVRATHPDETSTRYSYNNSHLTRIEDRGVERRFEYDEAGRISIIRHGDSGASVYRYDEQGRVTEARTSALSTVQSYHPNGQVATVRQTYEGVTLELRLEYDDAGRLSALYLPGGGRPVRYTWDEKGRPLAVALGGEPLAHYDYLDEQLRSRLHLRNGVVEETEADPVDRRPAARRVLKKDELIFERFYEYDRGGLVAGDGVRRYEYDALDRLERVDETRTGRSWRYLYDELDNRIEAGGHRYRHDPDNRLVEVESAEGSHRISYDRFGRLVARNSPAGRWTYRYDDAGRLLEARHRGSTVARFVYDHKGRLVAMRSTARRERYLYGPDDQLVAVTDELGVPLRSYIRTPLGMLAEIHGCTDERTVVFHHQDHQGTRHLLTGEDGRVVARWEYDPFGAPSGPETGYLPMFGGRVWYPEVRMYYFGARWYDPDLGRFLTPDSYTGGPDDERLVHPFRSATSQGVARSQILGDWLGQPRVRNRYAFCANDPVGRTDPNGHWSFGWTLLSLLGAIWTLPNTLIGLFLEITCLVGEVIRWLAWLLSFGHVTWETPGFDVAASSRLHAFALVFEGGWLGSIPGLLGITFGNVFFVHGRWEENPYVGGPGVVYPPAYRGEVSIPRSEALYEHELRHTNQYGWFGPFFHLGLPLFGVYEWDLILNGFRDARLERDASDYSGLYLHETPDAGLYGGYDLGLGDRDAGAQYGGAARSAARGEALPGAGETPYVQQLQQDLQTLGFRIVGNDDGAFGRQVSWAVREFQAYARMENVAYERAPGPGVPARYVDRLSRIGNPPLARYTGPVSGVVNAATRIAIRHWLASRLRCPVVIDAMVADPKVGPGWNTVRAENIWLHDEVTSTAPRMFVRDFSRYYTYPPTRNPDDPAVLGDFTTYLRWSGPKSLPPDHTWAEGELLPEHLVGPNLAGLTAQQRSTYKVVRAVSERECVGYFDSVNSYDNAFVSLGPCHWTLGIVDVPMLEGELCGYLAYLRHADPDAFRQAFEFFGVRVDEDWVDAGVPNGRGMFDPNQRKYVGWIAAQQEDGSFGRMPLTESDGNYFKTWHWFYRFVMAGRTIEGFRRRMWHMARVRLRDIRSTPWGPGVPNVPDGAGGTRAATIGDVFTSERAMALLLRWHIRFPNDIISGGQAGSRLRGHPASSITGAFGRAGVPPAAGNPTGWNDGHEAALVAGIMDEVSGHPNSRNNADLTGGMTQVHDWPTWAAGGLANRYHYALDPTIGNLATTRNSFQFDASDLPPPP